MILYMVQINRGWHKDHFWSNYHDYSTTTVSFSNSPSADTRHSPHTQITGKPPVVFVLACRNTITNRDIKGSPVNGIQNAAHVKTITIVCNMQCESPQKPQNLDTEALQDYICDASSQSKGYRPTNASNLVPGHCVQTNFVLLHWSNGLLVT